MKKVLLLFLVPLLALASSCSYDDTEVKDRLDNLDNKVAELEKMVKALNSDVTTLQDLISNKRFISGVTNNPDGSYTITLVTASGESSTITIKNGENGTDGKSPVIAVKQDTDGIYYWTLNGEFILAGGKKLPVTGNDGVTPQFKIENNNWYVSYDKGASWTECGKATYDSSLFKSVEVSEDGKQVYLTLADGTKLTFDLYTGFGIVFEIPQDQTLRVGETMKIPFTLTGADDKTLIEALPSGDWQAEVIRDGNVGGEIKITAPADSQTGKVIVLVNDGGTKTLMRTLTFVAGVLDITTSATDVPTGGGSVTIEVETDLEYNVVIPEEAAGWITLPEETRGDIRHETITLKIAANTEPKERKATIELVSGNTTIETILIFQMAYYEPESMVVKAEAQASLSNIIYLPLFGAVNATVNWGDGNIQKIEETISTAAGMIQHTYAEPGNYYISIKGSVAVLNSNLIKNTNKPGIVEVIQWGKLGLTSLLNAFKGDTKLVKVASPGQGAFASVTTAASMFDGCTALTSVPEDLFAEGGNITSIASLFYGCKALTSVPENLFAKMTGVTSASSLFANCTTLESVPAGLFNTNRALENLSSIFSGCTALTSIPDNLFAKQTAATSISSGFNNCSSLTEIPESLFASMTEMTNMASLFNGCSSIATLPEGLFSAAGKVVNISNLFKNCSSLETLPNGILKPFVLAKSASSLFEGCVKMTTFPDLKSCVTISNVTSFWKNCTALVEAPADYFPESVKDGISASYIFSGCTALKSVPEGLFEHFTGTTILSETFRDCTSLESLPAGIFNSMPKIKTVSDLFNGCVNFTGESPYTTITVENAPVNVHLYERENYPDFFVPVTSFKNCFKGCTQFADYANIPISWGGISDGTKAKPTFTLNIALTEGQEYHAVSVSFKSTEIKSSNKWTIMTPERLQAALEELQNDPERVCTKYGIAYNIAEANSENGIVLNPITVEQNTKYIFMIVGRNAHGLTVEQREITSAPIPKGEANYERYIGTWKVTSTSSQINKTPQSFTIEIEPYRVNESYRVTGWGISTLGDEFPFMINYTDGNLSIWTKESVGIFFPYYVYLMYHFYDPVAKVYKVYVPDETPLATGSYNTEKDQIIIKGEKFTTNGQEYTVSGLEYALYSNGQYNMAENLYKPGYTIGDNGVGPYTLTKVAPTKKAKQSGKIESLQPGNAPQAASVRTGAYSVTKK